MTPDTLTFTPQQALAARGALRWPLRTAAVKADVAARTILRIETGQRVRPSTARRLRRAYEAHGITFGEGRITVAVR